jgi:hypothetical protein
MRLRKVVEIDHVALPEPLQAAWKRVDVLQAAVAIAAKQAKPPLTPGQAYEALVNRMLAADDPLSVEADGVAEARHAEQVHGDRLRMLRAAVGRAEQHLQATVVDMSDDILAALDAHLSGELWPAVERAVQAIGDVPVLSPAAMLRAPDEARQGYLELQDHTAAYDRLRLAATECPQQPPELDHRGCHAEIEVGYCVTIGPAWYGTSTSEHRPTPPWGSWDDVPGRLAHLARAGVTPWITTSEARDKAWQRGHPEQYEASRRQQALHGSVHALSADG